MGKFDNLLIVSDLDGTFFGAKSAILSNNLEAVSYFRENGGAFTIATGRDIVVLRKIFPQVGTVASCPAILCNGSYLYDFEKNTLFNEVSLDKDEFLSTLEIVRKAFPNVGFRISSDIGFLCPYMPPFLMERMAEHLDITDQSPLSEQLHRPWHKCVFVAESETITEIGKLLNTLSFRNISATTSHSTLCELIPRSSGKGKQIGKLRKYYPKRKIICVGDNGNDLDMLQVADVSACPENALDSVKSISTIHLCHHRDGCIADLIYKLDSSIKE